MKFGLRYASAGAYGGPDLAVPLAKAAEAVGFESIWTIEHTVVPAGYAPNYPYSADGRMAGGQEDVAIPDPIVWLAFVAAAAPSLKLGTGVVILPQHNPVTLAKATATLDHLSRGRLLLGIGVGWMAEEFATLGVPFEDRGRRTDEYVAALRALWGPGPATFEGELVRFDRVWCEPRPRHGRVPVLVGGHTRLAARRAGRLGDGFFPTRGAPWDLVDEARRTAEACGRDPDELEITLSVPADLGELEEYAARGVSRVLLPVQSIDDVPAEPSVAEVHRWADVIARWG